MISAAQAPSSAVRRDGGSKGRPVASSSKAVVTSGGIATLGSGTAPIELASDGVTSKLKKAVAIAARPGSGEVTSMRSMGARGRRAQEPSEAPSPPVDVYL